jgi:DnaK suppressor protein
MTSEAEPDTTEVRRALGSRLADIDEQLTTMSAPPTELSNISFGKRVGDGTQMAVDRLAQVAAHEKLLAMRPEVLRALAKLEEGSYGRCDVCGGPIGAERLAALPWATRCVKDAARS